MVFLWLFLLLVFSLILIKAADWAIHSLKKISLRLKISVFAVSAILVALGTCLPEMVVAITSALDGRAALSLGNVLGANIANISLVVGLSAFLLGGVNVRAPSLKKDLRSVWLVAALLLFLMTDGILSRVDGLILILAYLGYLISFLTTVPSLSEEYASFGRHLFQPHFNHFNQLNLKLAKELIKLVAALGVLLFSAEMVVRSVVNLTSFLNLSIFDIGLVFVAIGTTLPELAISVRSIKDNQPAMFLGNILGSLIANWTLVIGIASFIQPIAVVPLNHYLTAVFVFIILYIIFTHFLRRKMRLEIWEAGVLLFFYLVFLFFDFV